MPLEAVASALPSLRQTAADIAAATGADEAFILDKVGVAERYILAPHESALDLAQAAADKLLAKTGLPVSDVGLIIFVTQTPDRRIPGSAPAIAARIGAHKRTAAFDLGLGCSGYVYGLAMMDAFLAVHGIANGLLLTCDPYSRIMAAEDKATNAVFGDAATASWVSSPRLAGGGGRLRGLDFGTDGDGAEAIRIEAGGARQSLVSLHGPSDGVAVPSRHDARLHMDGRAVFNFVNSVIPGSITASLEKAELKLRDIDYFALHQGSAFMLQALAKRADIPEGRLLMNIKHYGNTVSSTVPMLLEELQDRGDLPGRKVLVSGFGVGLSWATGILSFPLPERGEG